jgi:type IV secretion system protein VirB9
MKRAFAIGIVATFAFAPVAHGERAPRAVRADARIRTVPFEHDNVVVLYGTLGVSTMIVLGDDERIATVAIGDSLAWQAVPDQSKRYLFIKPLEPHAVTNMNIVTTKRIYNFVLHAGSGGDNRVVFKVRFSYPDEEESARLLAKAKALAAMPNMRDAMARPGTNFDYSYKGRVIVKPEIAFDDGIKTYFRFSGEVPGIFVVNSDMSETLMNYRREGEMIVVDRVVGQWTMRNGPDTACVFNMRAIPEPRPRTSETDVQPALQEIHAPRGNFFTRIFATDADTAVRQQQ